MSSRNTLSPYPNILPSRSIFRREHGADRGMKDKGGRKVKMDIGLFGILTDNDTGKTGFVVFPVAFGNIDSLRPVRDMQRGISDLAGGIGLSPSFERNGRTADHENDAQRTGSFQKLVDGIADQLSYRRSSFFGKALKCQKKRFRDKHAESNGVFHGYNPFVGLSCDMIGIHQAYCQEEKVK